MTRVPFPRLLSFVALGVGTGFCASPARAAGDAASAKPSGAAAADPSVAGDSAPVVSVNQVLGSLQYDLEPTIGTAESQHLICLFRSAGAADGKMVVTGAGVVEAINDALSEIGKKVSGDGVATLVDHGFPRALVDDKHKLWRKYDGHYVPSWMVTAAAADDVWGTLYAADPQGRLFTFEEERQKWRYAGVDHIRAVQSSDGVLYYMQEDGGLFDYRNGVSTRLSARNVMGTLLVSHGVIYVLEGGRLARYQDGHWDRAGEPIQANVASVLANGPNYFTLDNAGGVFSSQEKRYIERKVKTTGIFLIGPNLLATAQGIMRAYDPVKKAWRNLPPSTGVPAGKEWHPLAETDLRSPGHDADNCFAGLEDKYSVSDAYAQGVEGTVILRIELDDRGKISRMSKSQGLGHGLDEMVMGWLRFNPKCGFTPAIGKDGRPVGYVIERYSIKFEILKDGSKQNQEAVSEELHKNVPHFAIKKDKLGGEMPHLPEAIKSRRRGSTVTGSYKICIDTSGYVSTVNPVGSVPGADEPIMATLRGWTYRPQPVPVCFIENFQFVVE